MIPVVHGETPPAKDAYGIAPVGQLERRVVVSAVRGLCRASGHDAADGPPPCHRTPREVVNGNLCRPHWCGNRNDRTEQAREPENAPDDCPGVIGVGGEWTPHRRASLLVLCLIGLAAAAAARDGFSGDAAT